MQIIPLSECHTTLYGGGQSFHQWAKTPAGCQPSGPGWTAPIIGRTEEEWLWCRPFDPVTRTPVVYDLECDTQPILVDVYPPEQVELDLAG
jgi:hypothetical protein